MNNNRQIMILQKLIENNNCTIKQLSLLCDSSYKTIQNEIRNLNLVFRKNGINAKIVSQRGIGIVIENYNNEEIMRIINSLKEDCSEFLNYDKEYYISLITFIILQNDYIKIDNLCDQLSLSRSVINELVSNSRKMLLKWEVAVNSRPHYGLFAKGLESDIRRFMFENLVLRDEKSINEFLNIKDSMFFTLREGVIATVRNFDVSINDSILEQLLIYIEVMTIRIMNGKNLDEEDLSLGKSSFEFILSERIAHKIENYINVSISAYEINWIYRFVIGKCLKKTESDFQINHELVERFLPDALMLIKDKYGYNFIHDIDLYTSMSIHFTSLIKRAKVNNYLINPMLDSIKTYSLLAYDMATDISIIINSLLNINLPDDEISYFAIHLHLAIERQKKQIIPRKALVVCPAGKGMSEMVAHHVRKQFGEYISELKTCGYYDLENIDYKSYDYIFTMTPLKIKVPLPVIEFSLNSNRGNVEKTKMQILGKKSNDFVLASLTPVSLFFNNIEAENKEDALKQIIKRIEMVVTLESNFYDSVLRREKIVSTGLDNGFAIPHPIDKEVADRSFFSVSILNNAVKWGKKKIRIVLLTYIKGDMEELDEFYDIFAHLVTNKEYEVALIEKPTYENFVEIVKEISEQIRNY